MIPLIIHQMWLDKQRAYNEIPEKYKEYAKTWKHNNPDFEYKFWNFDNGLQLIEKYGYMNFFNDIQKHIEKCDFLRYVILYEHGGVYVDLDYKCQKSILPLIEKRKRGFVAEPSEHAGPNFYSNSFMAVEPKDSLIKELIDNIINNYKVGENVLVNTGPTALSKYVGNKLDANDKIDTPLIIPYNEKQQLKKDWDLKDSYAYTLWNEGTNWANEVTNEMTNEMTNEVTNIKDTVTDEVTNIGNKIKDFFSAGMPKQISINPIIFIFIVGIVAFLLTTNGLFLIVLILIVLFFLIFVLWMNIRNKIKYIKKYIVPIVNATTKIKQLIPGDIYQTNEDLMLPSGLHKAITSWREMNPDYNHHYYTTEDAREFIKEYYPPEYLQAYDSLIPGAYKADFWRYCILYIKGGVYADSAMVCQKPLTQYIRDKDKFISVVDWGYDGGLYNAFIATTPGHPIIGNVLEIIMKRIKNKEYGKDCLWPTGPRALGTALNRYWDKNDEDKLEEGEYPDGIRLFTHLAYPEKATGYIKYKDNEIILTKYPGAKEERKIWSKKPHYGELWRSKNIYC